MTIINLFPATMLAGSPNSGKSVLAYYLSISLKKNKTPFILLRTAPDGEGDWFLEAERGVGIALRQKKAFTPALIRRAERAIRHRQLPMLVDVGGRPQGQQFRILHACTHYILLYRTDEEERQWRAWLDATGMIPIAILRSDLQGEDRILSDNGPLRGVISGLDRSRQQPLGPTFQAVFERIRGIFDYAPEQILARHLRQAPEDAALVTVDGLAKQVGLQFNTASGLWWEPAHLSRVLELLPQNTALALYGRGPTWLYAAVAAAALPHPFYLFDARHFGWMRVPDVRLDSHGRNPDVSFNVLPEGQALRLQIQIRETFIIPQVIYLPPLPPAPAIILDGKAPLWLYAGLTRALAARYDRIHVYDPRLAAPPLV